MKLTIFKLLYRITKNRYWIIRYVDELERQIKEEIKEFRNETN